MTMRVVYLRDHDGHKAGKDYSVEETLGARVCEIGIAMPYIQWVEKDAAEKKAAKEAKEKIETKKPEKEDPVKKFKKDPKEKSVSKKQDEAEKAITE